MNEPSLNTLTPRLDLVATWLVAIGTLILAAVAVFQETIRSWFYRPSFRVTCVCAPPDCVWVPIHDPDTGAFVAHAIYLRLWIENAGNATARNVEVYAKELRRERADGSWERVQAFPPMNLRWTNLGTIYFPSITAKMGKHCDLGHIVDPPRRYAVREENAALGLTAQHTSLAFDLMVAPTHMGHIIGPGVYRLDILVAAENAVPLSRTVEITLRGPWYPDEAQMLRDGVGVRVV